MAIDPWVIDASGGVPTYAAQEARLAMGAAFVHTTNALGVRSGVIPNGGLTALWTTAQGTPNMTVNVAVGQAVVQGSTTTTQGPYIFTSDAAKTVTIAAAHATLPRIDVVAVRIRDSNVSGSGLDGDIVAITGTAASTPSAPGFPADGASYLALAHLTVGAAAPNVSSGNIANQWQWTTTTGGQLLVETKAKLDAITNMPMGQPAYVWVDKTSWNWNGTTWIEDAGKIVVDAGAFSGGVGITTAAVTHQTITIPASGGRTALLEGMLLITPTSTSQFVLVTLTAGAFSLAFRVKGGASTHPDYMEYFRIPIGVVAAPTSTTIQLTGSVAGGTAKVRMWATT